MHPNFSNRIGYSFADQNYVARDFSFCVLLNISAIVFYKKKVKWLLIIPILFFLYFILLTGSISNLLVVFLSGIIVVGYSISRKKKIWFFISLVFLTILFIFLINLPLFSYFKNRLNGMISAFTGSGATDPSFVNRFMVTKYGLSLWLSKPLFGNGYSSVYRNYFIMAHNNMVEILADYGLIAFIIEELLLFLPVVFVIKDKRKNKKTNIIILLFALYMLLLQPFLVEIDSKAEMIFLPFCYCFGSSINYNNQKNRSLFVSESNFSYIEINI